MANPIVEAVMRDKEALSAVICAIPTPLFVKGSDCKLIAVNSACEEMWGFKSVDLVGRSDTRYASHGSYDGYMPTDMQVFDSRKPQVVSESFMSPKGPIKLLTTKSPFYDESDNPVCLICAPRISESVGLPGDSNFDLHLLHLHRLSTLGMLVSGIAHDLRNIISTIKGPITLMKNKLSSLSGPAISYVVDWLNRIDISCDHGISLLENLLSFASVDKKQKRETISVQEVINEVISLVQISPKIEVYFNNESHLYLDVNVTQLKQVFINLCMNSIRAKTKNVVTVSIFAKEVFVDCDNSLGIFPKLDSGNYVCISVSDDGCGLSSSSIKKIFEPFFTTGDNGNFGLGLTIVRDIVVSHGGGISVESNLGVGTTFHIYFPKTDLH